MGVWIIKTAIEADPGLKDSLSDEEINTIENLAREIKVGRIIDNKESLEKATDYQEVVAKLQSLKEEG